MDMAREEDQRFVQRATEAAIRIGLVAILVYMCFAIVRPFVMPVAWGVILAVAIHPLYLRLARQLGGRRKTAATLVVLIALAVLLIPTVMFLESVTGHLVGLARELSAGTVTIPSPPEGVGDWPVIGKKLEAAWAGAVTDMPAFLANYKTQLAAIGGWILSSAANLGLAVLGFAFSIVIAGILLATSEGGTRAVRSIGKRLAGEQGVELVGTSAATIRSVAMGVVGVALIQSFLAGIGFVAVGIPAAGVLALVVLLLAIVQLPTLLVMLPAAIYVFTTTNTTGAIIFAIWAAFVGVSDNILKPLLLGRGVSVPMLVILIGAIGGMVALGILGLFIGAVVLALGQQLYVAWAKQEDPAPAA